MILTEVIPLIDERPTLIIALATVLSTVAVWHGAR